jgi:hypothetical protein
LLYFATFGQPTESITPPHRRQAKGADAAEAFPTENPLQVFDALLAPRVLEARVRRAQHDMAIA